ncbi:MAG: VWA domain-containing protein [Gemmatimonadaceae bacterium]
MIPFLRGWEFASPLWLLLLPVVFWWLRWRRHRRPEAIMFSRVDLLQRGPARGRWAARALLVLRTVALVAATVALARPRAGARTEQVTGDGISIALLVDLSSSMLAEDFQPQNRLEVAKEKIKRFVMGRRHDAIGLVSFSGEALTQVPLTIDYPVVLAAVDNLQSGQLEDGTAIGTAIATAATRLRDAPGRSKVMILLTDGVNNRGAIDPRTAAQAAAALGIRVYTIGIGSEGMAPVPVGRGVFGLRYENRKVEIDEPLLTDIATMTNGRYFRARDGAALQRIYEQIDQLERVPLRSSRFVRYNEFYVWPLGLALAALILELLLLAWRGPLP